MKKILFICEGNVCRSPIAAAIFSNIVRRNNRSDIIVESAGTAAFPGQPMAEYARIALLECGEDLPNPPHRATQLTPAMRTQYNYIIDVRDIPDPWGSSMETYINLAKTLQKRMAELYRLLIEKMEEGTA